MARAKGFLFIVSVTMLLAFGVALAHVEGHGSMKGNESGMMEGMKGMMCKMCPEGYRELHSAMQELGKRTSEIIMAIIFSNLDSVEKSARAMTKMANKLSGTYPHYRLSRYPYYRRLVRAFGSRVERLSVSVKGGNAMDISEAFGKVISTCVECHMNFRDISGPASSNTRHYPGSAFTVTDNGLFSVEALPPVRVDEAGNLKITLIIHDDDDQDLEGGSVQAFYWDLENGERAGGLIEVEELQGGRYSLKYPGTREGKVVFFVEIEKKAGLGSDAASDGVVLWLK